MKNISLITFVLWSLIIVQCSIKEENKESTARMDVNTITVKTVDITHSTIPNTISTTGVVMSENEVKPSFKTGGVIAHTFIKEGDMVRKGQLLATLHMDEINAQVAQTQEALAKAQRDLTRAKNLYQDSVATLEQYQNATSAFEFAKRNVEIATFNRQYSETRSAINGKVVKLIARTGEIVGPGMPICVILGTGPQDWIIKVGLVDKDWSRINIGNQADISFDAYPGESFTGHITDKGIMSANASGTFDVEIKLDHNPPSLAVGLIAKVFLNVQNNAKMSIIPIESLVKTDGQHAEIFIVKDGKAHKVQIKIGEVSGDKVFVISGLENITKVITAGALFLEEGDRVKSL